MWSAGVIFFQMLYGRRPFGHEMTQVQCCVRRCPYSADKAPVVRRPSCAMKPFSVVHAALTSQRSRRFRKRRVLRCGFMAKTDSCLQAKAFIRRCLTYSQAERPDVFQAANDTYLSFLKTAAKETK